MSHRTFCKAMYLFHSKPLCRSLTALHAFQHKRRKKLKHKYKQLFIYPYQMRVRAILVPCHSFTRAHSNQVRQKRVYRTTNSSCKSEAKCCVHSIFPFYCSMPWLETSNFMIIPCAFFFLFSFGFVVVFLGKI